MTKTPSLSYYEVLGIDPDATTDDVRRAYLRRARECHPDKNPSEDAKAQFQHLQRVYAVLSSPKKRAVYDECGSCEEDDVDGRFGPKLTEEDILSFAKDYLGSDVEKEDLVQNVIRFKGDMNKVFSHQILSDEKLDAHRFVEIIEQAVTNGDVRSYKSFEKWRCEVEKRPRSQVSFEKRFKKRRSATDVDELALIEKIQQRGAQHREFVNNLKTRFCGDGPTPYDDITEEEFQAAQSRLLSNSNSKKPKKEPPVKKPISKKKPKAKATKKLKVKEGGVQKRRSARLAKK